MQRILALKRHEQPPPAFFHGFSEKVIDRIQSAGPAPRLTLRQRLSVEFYGVPIYLCAAGVIVCGLLVAGLIGSFQVDSPEPAPRGAASQLIGGEPSHAMVPPQPKPQIGPGPGAPANSAPTVNGAGTHPGRATLAVPDVSPGQ